MCIRGAPSLAPSVAMKLIEEINQQEDETPPPIDAADRA